MSQMNRRRALQLLAALGATGLAAGCDSDSEGTAPGSPIKVGLIVPGSGPNKAIGEEITNGFQLFLSLNDQQLGGHPVTLVTAEEGDSAKTGQAAVDRLLKEGVLALTGVVSPTVIFGIRDAVEQARIPLIGSNASPISLQSVVYIWRTSYVLSEPGEALGHYLRQTIRSSSQVTVFAPKTTSSRDIIEGFRAGLRAGRSPDQRSGLHARPAQPGQERILHRDSQGAAPKAGRGLLSLHRRSRGELHQAALRRGLPGPDLRARLPHRGHCVEPAR